MSTDKKTVIGEIGASHQSVFGELVRISLDITYHPIFNITVIDSILLVYLY
jgi:hypothetical protein